MDDINSKKDALEEKYRNGEISDDEYGKQRAELDNEAGRIQDELKSMAQGRDLGDINADKETGEIIDKGGYEVKVTVFGHEIYASGPIPGPEGCGDANTGWVPDRLFGVNMRPACDEHDIAYTPRIPGEEVSLNDRLRANADLGARVIADNPYNFAAFPIGFTYTFATDVYQTWLEIMEFFSSNEQPSTGGDLSSTPTPSPNPLPMPNPPANPPSQGIPEPTVTPRPVPLSHQ
jgi:hypothetical protein